MDELAQSNGSEQASTPEIVDEPEQAHGQVEIAQLETQPLPEPDDSLPIEAVVAGHICLDIIPTLVGSNVAFAPGRLIEASGTVLATGGPVSNTGLALHKLGINTRLMGKVGKDLFGQAIFQIIESYGPGLARGMVVAPGETSSYSIIVSPPNTDRFIIHAPGCNDTFSAEDVRYDLLENVQLFHFGYPPLMERMYSAEGAELASIFKRVKAAGVTTSLDLSMPDPSSTAGRANWQAILAATLPHVDVFLPSLEELLFMLRRPLFDKLSAKAKQAGILNYVTPDVISELGKTLLDMGAKVIGLKIGHRGLYLRTSSLHGLEQMGRAQPPHLASWVDRELWAPCFITEVVGTTGSGDATIAGFLLGLLRGMKPEATLSAACAVGACNVEKTDALSGIKSWPEIMTRIAEGWPRLILQDKKLPALDMTAAGWRWDEVHEVWTGPANLHRP